MSEGAKKAPQRNRTSDLSKPKETHRDYQVPREVEWPVSQAAKGAKTSSRIESLALPKERKEGAVRCPEWVVSKGARYDLFAKLFIRKSYLVIRLKNN